MQPQSIEISPQRYRHEKPSRFPSLESKLAPSRATPTSPDQQALVLLAQARKLYRINAFRLLHGRQVKLRVH
jgi:hypothetical protein